MVEEPLSQHKDHEDAGQPQQAGQQKDKDYIQQNQGKQKATPEDQK